MMMSSYSAMGVWECSHCHRLRLMNAPTKSKSNGRMLKLRTDVISVELSLPAAKHMRIMLKRISLVISWPSMTGKASK